MAGELQYASLPLTLVALVHLVAAIVCVARSSLVISALGIRSASWGSPGPGMCGWFLGVFLPVGLILTIVAWLQHFSDAPIVAGYATSALFRCDPGSPMLGSFRQAMHNPGAGIQYVARAFSLLWISETAGPVFRAAGSLVAVSEVLLSFESRFRGLVQRTAELCSFAGMLAALGMKCVAACGLGQERTFAAQRDYVDEADIWL